jgi:predicted RNase H-like HicB family nuclease
MKTPKNYLQQPYARIVIPTEPSGFHAEILEFPGCFAQGDTPEEAYANLEKAAESWIEACLSQGQEVPEASSSLTFSGRIVLRLPRGIHRQASRMAERDQISLNTYLVSAVSARVGAEDFYKTLADRFEHRILTTVSTLTQEAINFLAFQTTSKAEIRSIKPENTAGNLPEEKRILANIRR